MKTGVGVNVVRGDKRWAYEISVHGAPVWRSYFQWRNPSTAMGAGERDLASIVIRSIEARNYGKV